MNFRILRPSMLLALALGLSACGGDDPSYDINLEITGLNYAASKPEDALYITDKISGTRFKVDPLTPAGTKITTVFPRKLSYGDEFHILVEGTDQPPHQKCDVVGDGDGDGGIHDSAGRMSSIKVTIACNDLTPSLLGSISVKVAGAAPTGLTLINGSLPAFTAVASTTGYAFNKLPYGKTYGLIIAKQPDDGLSKCKLLLNSGATGAVAPDGLSFSGEMGDTNVIVDVDCTAP
jgi:hypothetical protein